MSRSASKHPKLTTRPLITTRTSKKASQAVREGNQARRKITQDSGRIRRREESKKRQGKEQ
jgi:hypothetical protein